MKSFLGSSQHMMPLWGCVLLLLGVFATQLELPSPIVLVLYVLGLAVLFKWLIAPGPITREGVTEVSAAHQTPERPAYEGAYVDLCEPGWPAKCAGHPHRYAVDYTARFQNGPVALESGLMYIARRTPMCDPYDVATLRDTIRTTLREEYPGLSIDVSVKHWIRFEDPVAPPGAREPVPDEVQRDNVILFRAA